MMPGVDGPSTLKHLRDGPLPDEVPVVFLTAKVRPEDQQRLRCIGATGVISKPFDPMTLPDEARPDPRQKQHAVSPTKGFPRLTLPQLVGYSDEQRAQCSSDSAKTLVHSLLRDVGTADVADLLNKDYPATRRSLDTEPVRSYALEVSTTRLALVAAGASAPSARAGSMTSVAGRSTTARADAGRQPGRSSPASSCPSGHSPRPARRDALLRRHDRVPPPRTASQSSAPTPPPGSRA